MFGGCPRLPIVIAMTVALGATWGLPTSPASATQAAPYLSHIAGSLRASSPGTEGKIWWVSKDNTLPPGWLLQTPNCWGQLQCSQSPPGGAEILRRMTQLIASAHHSVDIAELYQAYGLDSEAIIDAAARACLYARRS